MSLLRFSRRGVRGVREEFLTDRRLSYAETMIAQRDICRSSYYAVPRMYMSLTGIWPFLTTCKRRLNSVVILMFSLSIFVPEILYALKIGTNMNVNDFFTCLPSITTILLLNLKLVIMVINHKKIKACFKIIKDDWLSLNTDIEKNILQRHAKYAQRMTTFYAVFMVIMLFFFNLKSIISLIFENDISNATDPSAMKLSRLPLYVDYGDTLNRYFFAIVIHNYIVGFTTISITTAVETFFYILIQHACGMFELIGHTLESIGKDSDENFSFTPDKISDDNYKTALNCLRRHLNTLRFTELIESIYTQIFLITIYLLTVIGTISGIQIMMNLTNGKDIAQPLAMYGSQLMQLLFEFWQGQFLMDYSVFPYESLSRGKWYYTSRRCRKIFLLILNRTISPCKITAGKIITLSIENYGMVLKSSLSFFTVLRSLQ